MPTGGDKLLITDLSAVTSGSITKPLVRLVQASAQTIPNNTNQVVNFSSETIDTDNFFNAGTSQSRVTPTKAGYYRCTATLFMATGGTYLNVSVYMRKNGTTSLPPGGRIGGLAFQGAPASAPVSQFAAVSCSVLIDCNGTTDYLEMIAFQTNTAAANQTTNVNAQYAPVLEVEFVRGL